MTPFCKWETDPEMAVTCTGLRTRVGDLNRPDSKAQAITCPSRGRQSEGGAQAHHVGEGRQLETPGNPDLARAERPWTGGAGRQALVQTSAVRKVWTPGAIY